MDYGIEPMTLGSPVNSPGHVSPVMHQVPHGSQYLPSYLMGESHAASTPTSSRTKSFSRQSQHHSPFGGILKSPGQKNVSQTPKFSSFMSPSLSAKDKVGTPPVHTLMEDVNQANLSHGFTDIPMRTTRQNVTFDPSLSINYGNSPSILTPKRNPVTAHRTKTPPSPGQSDPFYTQGEMITPDTVLDDTWVTIFGFLPSSASFVLQRFSQYGNIRSHHTASNGGNWMHIQYETSLQARKALSRNGKVLPGNMMIGVVPCIDVKLMAEQSVLHSANTSLYQSPSVPSHLNKTDSSVRPQKPPSLRPLTAAYNAAASEHTVTSDVSTPQKTNGILTKAMDYLFG